LAQFIILPFKEGYGKYRNLHIKKQKKRPVWVTGLFSTQQHIRRKHRLV